MNIQRKTQLQRIAQIAMLIQNKPLSKAELIEALDEKMSHTFCNSQIEKDIFCLRMDMDAPIVFNKKTNSYEMTEPYDFKDALFNFLNI